MNVDKNFMKRAIALAKKGTGHVSPNPRVGAVLVKNGIIVAEGYHKHFGAAHAEADALSKITKHQARNSTLYVNLEPCDHYGKTPPCSDLIISSGISQVVIGVRDPNPRVNGRGIQKLLKSKIVVREGVLQEACENLNRSYFKFIRCRKPFISVKIAQSLDGNIASANGHSRWITSPESRKWVHQLRRDHDSVLVGIGTVLQDDPQLNVRHVRGESGYRIVLDSQLRISKKAKLLHGPDPEKTIIVTTDLADGSKIQAIENTGVHVWNLKHHNSRVNLSTLWKKLADFGIISVLVEGGKTVFTSVLNNGQTDRLYVVQAPKLLGSGLSSLGDLNIQNPSEAMKFKKHRWKRRGPDIIFEGWL